MAQAASDVEAVLFDGRRGRPVRAYVAPITACARLADDVRRLWTGWSGGDAVEAAIDAFFAGLDADVDRNRTQALVP
jgi:hypothetical protein